LKATTNTLFLVLLTLFIYNPPLPAQYSKVSEHFSLEKFQEIATSNRVKSVTKFHGDGKYDRHPEKHYFKKNGFLQAWHTTSDNIYKYETDSLGNVIKSYTFPYENLDTFTHYSTYILDTLGNRSKSEHFYASGKRHHFNEQYQWEDNNYYYLGSVEAGQDSSVIRIKTDTINQYQITDYFSYQDGYLIGVDTYWSKSNTSGQTLETGDLSYDEALSAWIEEHPDDWEKLYSSIAARYALVDSDSLDSSLFEKITNEKYSYHADGNIKRADDYMGIREYEYDERGFPIQVKEFDDNNVIKSTTKLIYDTNGLLKQEISIRSDRDKKDVLNYIYEFW